MGFNHDSFRDSQREYIFKCIARFCHLNGLRRGYYLEFGCHRGRTLRLAWDHSKEMFEWTYVAFDSFEGMPEITEIDHNQMWKKGSSATSEAELIAILESGGMPRDRLITVSGFYDQSLTSETAERLLPQKAAVIYIDCDLYISTVPVLTFIRAFLQTGTIIIFDDWFCLYGDPERGQRRAWAEFRRDHPHLRFVDFISTGEAQGFIHVGASGSAEAGQP
jgi:O-methyltransferase